MICAMYLRKSRADAEAEARGEGETLARHEKMLREYAEAHNLVVLDIYREIVSGDTIADRPEMQRLLSALERDEYDAVLCADIDRLGRGDGSDQAMILKSFKYSGTQIITPYKTYDPRSEMDEEYLEYVQLIARGELKRIKRRMWAGRVASAKEGKWQGKVPFGYRKVKLENERGYTLEPHPLEAEAVRSIFRWYGIDGLGKGMISDRLNALGFHSADGNPFEPATVGTILRNPVYIGMVTWAKRRRQVVIRDGAEVATRPINDAPIHAPGLHPAILTQELWDAVAERLKTNKETHTPRSLNLVNPLAGLLYCSECGRCMRYLPEYKKSRSYAIFRCFRKGCITKNADVEAVYSIIKDTLRSWLDFDSAQLDAAPQSSELSEKKKLLAAAHAQIDQLKAQLSRVQDLLETGVYTAETYVERSKLLNERIAAAQSEAMRLLDEINAAAPDFAHLRPTIQHILDVWPSASPDELNRLLKTVIRRIDFHKTVRCYRNNALTDHLTLDIYPIS